MGIFATKIKLKVYVNQRNSIQSTQTLIKHAFLVKFTHELFMSLIKIYNNQARILTPKSGEVSRRKKVMKLSFSITQII